MGIDGVRNEDRFWLPTSSERIAEIENDVERLFGLSPLLWFILEMEDPLESREEFNTGIDTAIIYSSKTLSKIQTS